MYTVRCPRCQHDMLYAPKGGVVGKHKRCVYCGMSFSTHTGIPRSRVVCAGRNAQWNAPLF